MSAYEMADMRQCNVVEELIYPGEKETKIREVVQVDPVAYRANVI